MAPPPERVRRPELTPEPEEIVELEVVADEAPPALVAPPPTPTPLPTAPPVSVQTPPPSTELTLAQLREMKKRRAATVLIERPPKKSSYVWVWLIVCPIILAGIAAWYVRRPRPHVAAVQPVKTPEVTATPVASPPPPPPEVADPEASASGSAVASAPVPPKRHPRRITPHVRAQPHATSAPPAPTGEPLTL